MHFGAGYGYSRFMTDDHKRHSHDHDHSHDSHSHSLTHTRGFFSSHNHAVANYGRAFAVGITLNLIFVLIEAGYGFFSNSLALLSDAGHNLSDVLGLGLVCNLARTSSLDGAVHLWVSQFVYSRCGH